jgi:hypothetical protein
VDRELEAARLENRRQEAGEESGFMATPGSGDAQAQDSLEVDQGPQRA